MATESERKELQPRMLASFSKPQLVSVVTWFNENAPDFIEGKSTFAEAASSALERLRIDEVMNEKTRQRLGYGIKVIGTFLARETYFDFSKIQGRVQVWQNTPDKNKLEIRVDTTKPNYFRQIRH